MKGWGFFSVCDTQSTGINIVNLKFAQILKQRQKCTVHYAVFLKSDKISVHLSFCVQQSHTALKQIKLESLMQHPYSKHSSKIVLSASTQNI